ncbi:MAG: hypothetical protein AB9891_06220 [Anaerolineaceae bacterium]
MSYPVNIKGFQGQKIEVDVSYLAGAQLLVNGKKAPKGSNRGDMLLKRDDGRQVVATWKPQALGFDVPNLVVDGQIIQLVEPLKWYQWLWSGLAVALVAVGGMLGAIIGLIALSFNAGLFRSNRSPVMKYVITGVVSTSAVIAYLIAAGAINSIIGQ